MRVLILVAAVDVIPAEAQKPSPEQKPDVSNKALITKQTPDRKKKPAETGVARQYTIEQFMATTRLGGASFSADEKSILFHSNKTGIFNVYAMPIGGGEAKQMTNSTKESTYAVSYFPADAEMPESKRHLEQRTLLYQVLELAFGNRGAIGCDQFVYWDRNDPRLCLAPDAFVCLGETNDLFPGWKVWERAIPQVAVEIVSESDERARGWETKLERYRRLGVTELVRFDSVAALQPLRIWERIGEDLVERELSAPCAASRALPGFWLAVEQAGVGLALRLSHDAQGVQLFPSEAEDAERRIQALEAELRRRS